MGSVATGKRVAAKQRKSRNRGTALLLTVGVTAGMIAWGYPRLRRHRLRRGGTCRRVDGWVYLALASVGAVACLFVGLMLISRMLRELGITSGSSKADHPPRPVGGRRAAR